MAEPPATSAEPRPSPAALLELADKEARGTLKVFLGAAPGVGKTYAMLTAAKALADEGVDVVVGVVETHGRVETARLLDGLDVLPRRPVPYRQRTLMELDVDAAIARRPQLLLVDEFAHSNAPGLLHPKRYQDVEEVLRAGIDVWTTLNIQHLESLTDVVRRITGVNVRETVPDRVLEKADEIVVVDLPPEELIQRLKEGKVYLPDNARRAVDQFFRLGNLTALRELALRRTADRVDEQMLAQLRQKGIEGPWPTAERLLVCVGSDPLSETVVRAASRMATALKADWIALNAAPSDTEITDRDALRRTERALRLADRLGATVARLAARDIPAEILAYAKRNNITQIVVGRSGAGLVQRLLGRALSDALVARAKDLSVTVITPEAGRGRATPGWRWPAPEGAARSGLAAALAVAAAILVGLWLEQITTLPNLSMVFLFAVLVCALRVGLWSAIAAAGLSFLAYNFFFIDPRHTFTVAEPYEFFSLLIFLVVAVAAGGLAGRLREQAVATRERAEATQALYDFSRKLSGAAKLDEVMWLLAAQAAATVKGSAIVLMPQGGDLGIVGAWPPQDTLATSDWAAARWAMNAGEPAGRWTGTLPVARFQFRPLGATSGPLGVIGVAPVADEEALPAATQGALQSIIDQAAIAIERTQLVAEAAEAEREAEGERLRSALLSSISHDLRTPLASIVGAVTSLRALGDRMAGPDRADLLVTIEEEAMRLSRFVANLLDMTRLEAGAIDIRRDLVDAGDAARGAAARARKSFPKREIALEIAPSLPLVRGDATLLEQVLFNLLDNADRYADAGTPTTLRIAADGRDLAIAVEDRGIGIPADALEKVFEKFYRVGASDRGAAGTGLGLSIAAGLIKAMGGAIRAESPVWNGRGTRIAIRLPGSHETMDGAA